MIEDRINRRIQNCLNKTNYPDVVTVLIKGEEMEVCFMTEYLWFNPKTKTIRTQEQYKYQGNFDGEKIIGEFIDTESLFQIYLRLTNPKEETKEFEGLRLDPTKKRITKDDREQISKYVANIENKNKSSRP